MAQKVAIAVKGIGLMAWGGGTHQKGVGVREREDQRTLELDTEVRSKTGWGHSQKFNLKPGKEVGLGGREGMMVNFVY